MAKSKPSDINRNIREIALTIFFSGFALILYMILKKIGLSEIIGSIVSFTIGAILVFTILPKVLGIPFGKIEIAEWVYRIGLKPPQGAWKHVLLGVALAACTLTGMYIASDLTGKYVFDLGNVTLSHMLFSLIPGFFEELLLRGVLMFILFRMTKSFEKAFVIQVVIFGLMHIKGPDISALLDVITTSILAISLTYTVYKTRSLMAAMVFHYLHDAFLFLVQIPNGNYQGLTDNALFFGGLWLMVGVSLLVTKVATDVLRVRDKYPLYDRSLIGSTKKPSIRPDASLS